MGYAAVEVVGERQVMKAMRELEPRIQKQVLRPAAKKATKLIQKEAIRRAPRKSKKRNRTGLLRKSIKTRVAKTRRDTRLPRNEVGFAVEIRSIKGVERSSFYGAFVELGTKYQPAQEFIRGAAKDLEPQVLKTYRDEFHAGLADLARKVRKGTARTGRGRWGGRT